MPRMTGSRFFAEAMQRYGVTHIFFVPTIMLPPLPSLARKGAEGVLPEGTSTGTLLCHKEEYP
jgi:thiamine pyrophosphate-dependent acetolactate synthase large subunit-like protein